MALEQLCKLCLLLGCKNPTEKTFAAILILVHCLDAGESISEPEKFQILQANKPAMKKFFLSAGEGGSFLEKLPLDVSECPAEILATAYPKGFRRFEPEGVDLVQLRVLTETFPLRKTNRAAPAHQLALQTGGHGGVDLIKGLFSLYDRARSSGSLEEKHSSDLPGFRLLQKTKRATAIADSKAELPLEDTKQVESPPATAAMASGTLQSSGAKQDELVEQKPEALIASLKAGLESEKKDGLCPKKKDRKKATSPKKKRKGWFSNGQLRFSPRLVVNQVKVARARVRRNALRIRWLRLVNPFSRKFQRNCKTSTDPAAPHAASVHSVQFLVGPKEDISLEVLQTRSYGIRGDRRKS